MANTTKQSRLNPVKNNKGQLANVLVLYSFRNHKDGYIEMLFNRLSASAKGRLNLYRGSLKDLHISVINNKLTVVDSLSGKDLKEFDAIYFELWYKAPQQALAAALYAKRHGVPFFAKEVANFIPTTKVGELASLSDGKVPLPNSFMSSAREIKRVLKEGGPFSYPFIMKAADGYGGKNNYLVKDYAHLCSLLNENKDLQFVLQEFVQNDRDYRCLVMGGEIVLVLERKRLDVSSHLNNTSAGAEGKIVPLSSLPDTAQEAVLKSARVLGRDDFAGVDLMLHLDTKKPYILEVNQTPQIEIGAETDEKMHALITYIEKQVKK